eukprot:4466019-Prymnesium_polylepis.1
MEARLNMYAASVVYRQWCDALRGNMMAAAGRMMAGITSWAVLLLATPAWALRIPHTVGRSSGAFFCSAARLPEIGQRLQVEVDCASDDDGSEEQLEWAAATVTR